MAGTVAQTIQGEAGSDPTHQFAVASTIYNRMLAGTFKGGTDPYAIVNAPNQFVGIQTPNASAQTFADAIQNGTLPNYGNTGNAVNFQSGDTAFRNGLAPGGANIGGNYFSDRFGPPTQNFIAPSYGVNQLANGPADTSSGLAAGGAGSPSYGIPDTGSPYGTGSIGPTGPGSFAPGLAGSDLNSGNAVSGSNLDPQGYGVGGAGGGFQEIPGSGFASVQPQGGIGTTFVGSPTTLDASGSPAGITDGSAGGDGFSQSGFGGGVAGGAGGASGTGAGTSSGTGSAAGGTSPGTQAAGGQGIPIQLGLQPPTTQAIGGWVQGAETATGAAFKTALSNIFGDWTSYFLRGFLLLFGVLLVIAALWIMGSSELRKAYI
jgi:hypothetical protein